MLIASWVKPILLPTRHLGKNPLTTDERRDETAGGFIRCVCRVCCVRRGSAANCSRACRTARPPCPTSVRLTTADRRWQGVTNDSPAPANDAGIGRQRLIFFLPGLSPVFFLPSFTGFHYLVVLIQFPGPVRLSRPSCSVPFLAFFFVRSFPICRGVVAERRRRRCERPGNQNTARRSFFVHASLGEKNTTLKTITRRRN